MYISEIPSEIINEYNLLPKVCNGCVYFCIKKAIYHLWFEAIRCSSCKDACKDLKQKMILSS